MTRSAEKRRIDGSGPDLRIRSPRRILISGALSPLLFFALTFTAPSQEQKKPQPNPAPALESAGPPAYRELWVPADQLDAVLAKMPRAVMLTPEQYRTLLRDAKKIEQPEDADLKPPASSVIRDVAFEGELTNEVARITARYTVESFTEEWSEIPLVLPRSQLAHIEIDDETALRVAPPSKGNKNPQPVLLVRGKGEHTVTAVYHLPVSRSPAGNAIQISSPGVAAASLKLTLPDGAKLDSALPFTTGEEDPNVARFVLPAESGAVFEIRWTAKTIDAIPDAAVFQTCSYLYSIDSTRIQADLGLVLSSSLADLPNRFQITLPENVRVLSVEGSELLSWDEIATGNGTGIEAILVEGKRPAADLRILTEADVDSEDNTDVTVTLPIVEIEGVHRASGTMALIGSEDVRVKNITTGPLTVAAPDALEAPIRNHPHFVTGFRFPVTTAAPEVVLSPVQERFKGQLDTRIELKREAIHLTRSLTLIPLEGRFFEAEFELPADEELLTIESASGDAGFSWTRIEDPDPNRPNRVRLAWQQGLVAGDAPPALSIQSRRDPEDWFELGEEPASLAFANALIPDAETVSGYVAVAFDDSFRVESATANGLEPRDGRGTPIPGILAWFRLSDYSLELNASRRATEIEAAITAYSLPLQSTLEIEGQLDLEIRYTPISEIVVKLDPAMAEFVRWDSPLLAEKRLDEDSGEWTLDFHDELSGFQRFRFRMALPFEMEESAEAAEQKKFAVSVPVFSIPAAKRIRGDWIVEANTDTELSFEANGVDAVDSLRVPAVAGYRPRHRVIAAYQYRGDAWELNIAGTRHAHEDLVSTVVDSLRIDTVVSVDGKDRHQAKISLRTSGEQFLEVGLPKSAVLWTLTVDGAAVKPVRAELDTLRIQLPAHRDASSQTIALKLVYQTPGEEWGGSGRESLEPIRLADRIPVMRANWFLHLPEGFDYQKFQSNLREEFEVIDRTLLGQAWEERDRFLAQPLRALAIATGAQYESAGAVGWTNYSPLDADLVGDSRDGLFLPRYENREGVPQVASRYVTRMQERVQRADEAALRGSQLRADGDFTGAIDQFNSAIELLPAAPLTRDRFEAYIAEQAGASVKLAQQRADEAEYEEARRLLERVLSPGVDPDNFAAKQLLERLDDPEYYSPALAPEHYARVRKVEKAHRKARGYIDIGDYDRAEAEYWAILNDDQYNTAARRSLEEVEEARLNYYDQSRDHTRAEFLRKVAEGWELPAPAQPKSAPAKPASAQPSAAFADAAMPEPTASPDAPASDLQTRTYQVPPNFLSAITGADAGGGAAAADPFAAPATPATGGAGLRRRQTAKEVLEQFGVNFQPGANATFDPATGQLTVRNTEEQMDLIEAATQPLGGNVANAPTEAPGMIVDQNGTEYLIDALPAGMQTQAVLASQVMVDSESGEEVRIGGGFQGREGGQIDNLVIPEFNVENQTLAEAVKLLEQKLTEGGSAGGAQAAAPRIDLGVAGGEASTKLNLNLKNVPLAEALAYLTEASGTEYRVTASGIVIASPGSLPADSVQTLVLELPNSAFETSDGNGGTRRMSARNLLTSSGIEFPPGTSAAYNHTTRRLAVKNTPANLDAVRALFESQINVAAVNDVPAHAAATEVYLKRQIDRAEAQGLKGFDFRNAGLIPLDFELPESGRSYSFAGLYAPEAIQFRYVNWERQIRFAWVWILAGALAYRFGAVRRWNRPILIGLAGVILLTFIPLVISQSLLAFCNSLLIGWIGAMLLWLAWRACDRLSLAIDRRKKEKAAGEEAASTA